MDIGHIILGILILAMGVLHLGWPRLAWRLDNFMTVKGGEPTDFALMMSFIASLCYIMIGGLMIYSAIYQ